MPDIVAPGVYAVIDEASYYADPCPEPSLTQSICKVLLDRSPAHARLAHPRLAPPAEDDEPVEKYVAAQAIGTAAHKLVLARGRGLAVCDFDSWRSDKAKTARAEAEARGLTPILEKHHERAVAMAAAATEQLGLAGFPHAFGTPGEVMIAWQENGLWFRSLIDWPEPGMRVLWDFKSTGLSVAPHALPKLMVDAGWLIQAAFQERGLDILDPDNAGRRKFRFVAQENSPPYPISICELPESVMDMGRKRVRMAIDIWSRCMRSGEWPSYPAELQFPMLPGYVEARWLDREIEHEDRRMRAPEPMLTDMMGG